jgi:site-specific DNA recombinase
MGSVTGKQYLDMSQRLKNHTLGELDRLNLQVADLEISDTVFQKYTRYGMSLLKDLTWYFHEAGLEAKRKLLGSIFPAKLTFQDGKYRTDGLNPALAIILQKTKNLESEKNGDIVISENVSGDVPKAGLEPTTFALRMRCSTN